MAEDTKLKQCSFCLVRYVPDPVRDEFLNIGLLVHSPEEEYFDCLFTDDFRRVKRFHQRADLEFLRELQRYFEESIAAHESDAEKYLREIQETYSNLIQVTPPRSCLLRDPQAEIQDLFSRYVGSRVAGPVPQDTRMRIKHRLFKALENAGVLKHKLFEKRIPAEQWTERGDPFTFDFGYRPLEVEGRPNGHIKLIHALSLRHDPQIADLLGVKIDRVRQHELAELTVVVEGLAELGDEVGNYSQRVLLEHRISLQPLAGVDGYAQSIGRELVM